MSHWYRLAKASNYISRFGLMKGLSLWAQIERQLPKKSGTMKTYVVPGFPAPIHLRDSISDHAIFWQCIVRTQYDFLKFPHHSRLMHAYEDAIRAGRRIIIIDCGANIGLASVWFATQFPEAIIYAVEPDLENFKMIKLNTAFMGSRIRALNGGIWSDSGYLRIVNPESGSAAFRVEFSKDASPNALRAYTISEVCSMAGVEAPFVVKIDIEGAQSELFMNNTDWVRDTHLITLELDDWLMPWKGTSRPFFSCLSRYPFEYLLGGEAIFCFRDFNSPLHR